VRIAASFAFLTLLGALFPTVASAATPIAAAGGSDLVTALVIAGGGALVIMLIMVALPAARRGSGSSAPTGAAPPVTAFRARPIRAPYVEAEPSEPAATAAAPATNDDTEDLPAAAEEQPAEQLPAAAEEQPAERPFIPSPLPSTRFDTPAPEPAPAPEQVEAVPEPATEPFEPAPEPFEPAPEPFEPDPVAAHPTATEPIVTAAEERSAVAVADPPSVATVTPLRPAPTQAAPDLLSTLSPAAVLGAAFDPERLRASMRAAPAAPEIAPETGVQALLRDHSLAVPIAACVTIGVTIHLIRARGRRR
jgi:hypothetical protein